MPLASAALRPALRASNFARGEVVELDLFYVESSNHNVGRQVARTGFSDQKLLVRPERFELPTSWFVARRSIQLSYGRNVET